MRVPKPPAIDYKRELEAASKSMILIHDPKILIKLILRMIVRKVAIRHAGMLLYDAQKDAYVLNVSRGQAGLKIPAGFARFDKNSPVIDLFLNGKLDKLRLNRSALLVEDINKVLWQESVFPGGNETKQALERVCMQMQEVNAIACVPAYYHNNLLAILLLGEKKNGRKFNQADLDFLSALAHDVAMAIRNAQLFIDLKKESEHNRRLFIQMTTALSATIEAKDSYTGGHTESVTNHCLAVARQMVQNGSANFSEKFFEDLQIAGLLHDIGKIGIPESILSKPGPLTKEEFEIMKTHARIGADILKPIEDMQECIKGVLHHHERYDGKGYPDGLAGDAIPMIAAVVTVCDSYDAMITDRPYRQSLGKKAAIEEIRKNIGLQFHPLPARALLELFETGGI